MTPTERYALNVPFIWTTAFAVARLKPAATTAAWDLALP